MHYVSAIQQENIVRRPVAEAVFVSVHVFVLTIRRFIAHKLNHHTASTISNSAPTMAAEATTLGRE